MKHIDESAERASALRRLFIIFFHLLIRKVACVKGLLEPLRRKAAMGS